MRNKLLDIVAWLNADTRYTRGDDILMGIVILELGYLLFIK